VPLARNLPEFGWEPVVLTPFLLDKTELPFRTAETDYRGALEFWRRLFRLGKDKDMKREVQDRLGAASRNRLVEFLFNRIGEVVNYPDSHRGWKPFALKAGRELLQKEKFDAVISCHPTIGHVVASELKGEFGLPWVADLPDLWSLNHNYRYSRLRRRIDRRLELRTLSKADAMTTISEPWAEKQKELHKGKPVYAITHGFDPAGVNDPPAELTKKFTITYTGTIYPQGQDTSKILAALQALISAGEVDRDNIELRFYGPYLKWLDKEIEKYGLAGIVKQYGHVKMPEAVKKQRESHLLLVLDWEDPREKGVYGGKIFEYLAAMRPILVTGGSEDGVINKLLKETQAGVHAATVKDAETTLRQFYHEYKQQGRVAHRVDKASLGKYSHKEMARQFSEILDGLI